MEKELIIETIKQRNKWWDKEFKPMFKDREIYLKIKKFLGTKQIISFVGLRRVGKTTMIFKIVQDLLSKFEKDNVFYFSFDEFKDLKLNDIIKIYEEIKDVNIEEGKYLLLFDEIQKVENWEEQLKRLYDTYPNIKFIISGSESLFIRKGTTESLAGRIFEFKINPLNFKEFLMFRGKHIKNMSLDKKDILKEFKLFLITNGFPEITNESFEIIEKYIREGIIEKVIYRDLTEIAGIKNASLLKSVFDVIYNNPGQIIELNKLSKEFGISRQTLSEYLDYLEKAFLIKKLYNYSKNVRKTERRLKKYYPSIINPYLIKADFPKAFETSVVIQLKSEYFWRDSFQNEVDIILIDEKSKDKVFPIEVKSGDVRNSHLKGLKQFQKKFPSEKPIIISYEQKKVIGNIKVIPFYEYLL